MSKSVLGAGGCRFEKDKGEGEIRRPPPTPRVWGEMFLQGDATLESAHLLHPTSMQVHVHIISEKIWRKKKTFLRNFWDPSPDGHSKPSCRRSRSHLRTGVVWFKVRWCVGPSGIGCVRRVGLQTFSGSCDRSASAVGATLPPWWTASRTPTWRQLSSAQLSTSPQHKAIPAKLISNTQWWQVIGICYQSCLHSKSYSIFNTYKIIVEWIWV